MPWIFVGLFSVAVVLGALGLLHSRSAVSRAASNAKKPIDVTLNDLNDEPVKLSSYRGKVVVVDVWTTWCGYCVNEIPELIDFQKQADKDGTPLQLIGIAMDTDRDDVRQFAAVQHFNYPILLRDDKHMGPLGDVDGYPTKFIIDKKGVIVDKIVGVVSMKTLEKRVAPYLK
ncbi:MAG TPA: TlpA disulfide reductase family protein [Armatimonadota bacterium]|nr:TlpA disulfide reductase family protein [Armatimonadota bacterium]